MRAPAQTDVYQELGELHDLFMVEPWERLRPALRAAFGALGPDDVVLDLGAGTGMGTRELARVTTARVVAVEPSRTMRSVLTARVSDDPDLSRRVTVRAGHLPEALDDVTGPVAGFVAAHMIGHLGERDRTATFARVRALCGPGAVGVVTVDPGGEPGADTPVEQTRQIGDLTYVARYLPSPDAHRFVSEYEVREGARVLRTERFAGTWSPVTAAQLRRELGGVGLAVDETTPGVVQVRRDGVP